jgi:hypothetical protein
MALSLARQHGNWLKWLVSLLLIVVFWRVGVYGVDWKSHSNVVALLIAIAVLALCVNLWKGKIQNR